MTTRTITGNIKSLTDSAVATGTVTFEKVATSTTGSTIHQSGVTTATTDGSGDFSIDLAVPASGSYRYRMILPNGASFYFSIASGASVNVATLIVAETIEDSDAIVEALAAYLPLSGGTLTGQLNFSGTTHAGIKLLSLTTAQRDALTPANGMVIYNSTTATGQVYQGGAWASVGGGGGASDVLDLTTTTGTAAQRLRVADAGGLEYRTTEQDLADLRDAGALATPDIGVIVQDYDADLAAIAALSPANDDVVQRKAGAWTNRTMAQLLTDVGASALRPTQTDIAGTTHTLTTANEGQIVASQSGSATVFTVPLNSAQAFTVGSIVGVEQQGAGVLTITATSGVTLNGVDGASKAITGQWKAAALRKVSTNGWVIIGAI